MSKQTHAFQAEVAQLLHLVTHSLYSNKEIFLRELVSNASDACDKLRYEALNNAALFEDQPNLDIRISFDKTAKTITIADSGIGMSEQEAIDHLGTIAKSGTKDFVGKLAMIRNRRPKTPAHSSDNLELVFIQVISSPTELQLKRAEQAQRQRTAYAGLAQVRGSLRLRK